MDLRISLPRRLFQSINRPQQFTYFIVVSELTKYFWYGHEYVFFEITIQKCRFDIHFLKFKIVTSYDSEYRADCCHRGYRRKSLVLINAEGLTATQSNKSYFRFVFLNFEDMLRRKYLHSRLIVEKFPCLTF